MQIYRDNRTGREVTYDQCKEDDKTVYLLRDVKTGNAEKVEPSIISVLVPLR